MFADITGWPEAFTWSSFFFAVAAAITFARWTAHREFMAKIDLEKAKKL